MKKLSVIIVRFQSSVLHDGHKAIINKCLELSDHLLIIIGSSRAKLSRKDPMDFETRKLMVEEYLGNTDFVSIIESQDFNDDTVWSSHIDGLIEKFINGKQFEVNLFGSRDSFVKYYNGKFKATELLDIEVPNISATKIRNEIYKKPLVSEDFRKGIIYASNIPYPKVYSTIDCAVFNEDYSQILLGRKATEKKFRFIGGFVDPTDLSYEYAAKREVFEETNVEIDGLEYICSMLINDWRYTDIDKIITTLFAGKYIMGIPKAKDDIQEIAWFNFNEIQPEDLVTEHSKLLIKLKAHFNPSKIIYDEIF